MYPLIRLLLLFFLLPITTAGAGQSLVVGVPCLDANCHRIETIESMMTEAYSRIGVTVTFKYLPLLRDLQEANDFGIDATLARTVTATRDYPNLIQVPFPLIETPLTALYLRPDIKITSWNDMRKYRVGVLRGSLTSLLLAKKNNVTPYQFNNFSSGFGMLAENRLDVIFSTPQIAIPVAQTMGIEPVYQSLPLYTERSYHYLNINHKDLRPKLVQAFKGMLEDGTSARLLGNYGTLLPALPVDCPQETP